MKKNYIQFLVFGLILFICIGSIHNPFITNDISLLNQDTVTVSKGQDHLYQEIKTKAIKYEIPAKDAKIDPVWKKTPGYNGLKVNVEKSYEKMKSDGTFNEGKLVFEQVPPSVKLEDLPAEAIYRGHPDKPMVSFLVNVAWGEEYIPDMLETLKKHGVTATFLLEGKWVKKNPDLAKLIVESGNEVGNHSYSHADFKTLSSANVRKELEQTNKVIEATTGETVKWFAPPSGSYRDEVVKIAGEYEMETLMWSVDTIDWQRPEPHVIVERVMNKVHPGAMILMHPTSSTAKSLETLIVSIKQKEYEIAKVSTLLSEERIIK